MAELYTAGAWRGPQAASQTRSILDPATGREIRAVSDAAEEDVDAAVQAAAASFARAEWRTAFPGSTSMWR